MTATPFTTALANARQAATETGNGVGRAALTPPATNGGPDVVVWFVDGATVVDEHPLRRILPRELVMDGGIDTAFFLLVREDRGAVEQSGAVVVGDRRERDMRERNMRDSQRFAHPNAARRIQTAVACHHAGTDADSRGRVSVTVDTRVLQPLQIDDARHWLSEYVTTVPSANTALFAWCAEADGQRRCFMAAVPEVNERGEASAKNEVDRSRAWWLLDQRVDAIDTTSKASATVFDDALDGRLYADPFESLGAPPTKVGSSRTALTFSSLLLGI